MFYLRLVINERATRFCNLTTPTWILRYDGTGGSQNQKENCDRFPHSSLTSPYESKHNLSGCWRLPRPQRRRHI
jgi:hypothetical protein